ncbi:uncharacterized protein LOC126780571 isoform X2 [Nymphalis io]|uniref:uncharacterized protein LOC126780571 isoform X2 n=1 Tax=Inachis io TaxID=171585 RepID=UPI002166DFC1|nr:uncharacterized protein LOC126780571 isoform X2 [Nymphalis io]
MGDGIRIPQDKRHRSSSSLAGVLEGVRSEKKLDVRASIPEVDDQFALAEARCDSLQEKIDLVKVLKRKRKLKKRSMTTITEPVSTMANVPLITFRSRPKKKVSQQPETLRRLETNARAKPTRGYVDPDVIEQQQMLNRVHGSRQTNQQQHRPSKVKSNRDVENVAQTRMLLRRPPADGDSEQESVPPELCGEDESSDDKSFNEANTYYSQKRDYQSRPQSKQLKGKRNINVPKASGSQTGTRISETERRQVVELFKNNEARSPRQLNINIAKEMNKVKDNDALYNHEAENRPMENVPITNVKKPKVNKNVKYRNRHYELPTVSSKMKRVVIHSYNDNLAHAAIPFVVSKSSAPSHNVGVNLQQILNGLRVQQPISKIPLTIAHHMGLRHVPMGGSKSAITSPTLQSSEMNVIKLGQRLLHLPSFKTMSYSRLLSLYRAGNSLVSRFLCANGRPHYFYTSMCDLTTNQEEVVAAKSKRRSRSQGEKQNLIEYVALFREYEQVEKRLNENYNPDLEKHKETLEKQLTKREKYIREIVRDTGEDLNVEEFRATIAKEDYQHLKYDLLSTQTQ